MLKKYMLLTEWSEQRREHLGVQIVLVLVWFSSENVVFMWGIRHLKNECYWDVVRHQLPAVNWCCRWWCKEQRALFLTPLGSFIVRACSACLLAHASQDAATARCLPLTSLCFPRVSSRCARKSHSESGPLPNTIEEGFFPVSLFDTCATNKKTCMSLFIPIPFTHQR